MSFPPRLVSPIPVVIPDGAVARGVISTHLLWHRGAHSRVILRVRFMGGTASDRELVLRCAHEWTAEAAIDIVESTAADAEIRVSFARHAGDWSYVGTDSIRPAVGYALPSMNLAQVEPGVIRHEFGHALGLQHEHQHPEAPLIFDESRVFAELSAAPWSWRIDDIRRNILDPLTAANVDATAFDRDSVMVYEIPKRWLLSGEPTPSNERLSAGDRATVKRAYGPRQ